MLQKIFLMQFNDVRYVFRIIGPWPNTYTFTKALTESMIKEIGSGLPLGIFRPGIGEFVCTKYSIASVL